MGNIRKSSIHVNISSLKHNILTLTSYYNKTEGLESPAKSVIGNLGPNICNVIITFKTNKNFLFLRNNAVIITVLQFTVKQTQISNLQ